MDSGWVVPQSIYIYRAPQCMSPRWNWDSPWSPTPLAACECALPPGPKGGGAHSPAAKGVGESQFQRLEKRLALCLLCGLYGTYAFIGRTGWTLTCMTLNDAWGGGGAGQGTQNHRILIWQKF